MRFLSAMRRLRDGDVRGTGVFLHECGGRILGEPDGQTDQVPELMPVMRDKDRLMMITRLSATSPA